MIDWLKFNGTSTQDRSIDAILPGGRTGLYTKDFEWKHLEVGWVETGSDLGMTLIMTYDLWTIKADSQKVGVPVISSHSKRAEKVYNVSAFANQIP